MDEDRPILTQLKDVVHKHGQAFDAFTAKHNERYDDLQSRVEEIESRRATPGRTGSGDDVPNKKYTKAFFNWIRKRGDSRQYEAEMQEAAEERKDITIGSDPGGGFGVPQEIARKVEELMRRFSPVRRLIPAMRVGTSDFRHLVNIKGTTSGWASETGTRSTSNTPQLREVVPTHGELYAYPQVSEWALDDIFFNVENWLVQNIAEEFAFQEGVAVISGNGTNKPTGMLNTTPVTTDDFASPLRAAAAYQYIDSVASPFSVNGSDALIRLMYKLHADYRSQSTWVMNSATAGELRRLKDTSNQYLWQPSMIAGQPDLLLGRPIEIWEDMPNIASGNFPVALGDFSRGYLLIDRSEIRVLRDPYTNPGHVRFYARRRVGGIPLVNDAIKFIRTS